VIASNNRALVDVAGDRVLDEDPVDTIVGGQRPHQRDHLPGGRGCG
jgi:hypothetical protein